MTTVPVHPMQTEYTATEVVVERRARVGWGSIMMGAVTAIGLQFIFTALGVALGVTIGSTTDSDAGDLSVMAFIWWLVTGTISLFVGGLVLGRAVGATRRENICIGAATMWAVVALFGFLVVWSGVGAGVAAATPLSMMAARDDGNASAARWRDVQAGAPAFADRDPAAAVDDRAYPDVATREEARSATRAASWWSVIGLLLGVGATWLGATAASRSAPARVATL